MDLPGAGSFAPRHALPRHALPRHALPPIDVCGDGAHFVTGDGSAKPNGVVTGSIKGVTGATGQSGVPSADELIDLYFSVIPEYRRAGTWMMSDATWAGVRKLKDMDGQYLIDRLGSGGELSLLGRPVVIDTNVANTGVSAKSVLFGDFSAYYIGHAELLGADESVTA